MLSDEKRAVRKAIRARLAELPQARFVACGEAMAAALSSMPEYGAARLVLAFLSMKGELDTRAALGSARELGKIVAVPRLAGGEIEFVRLPSDWESWPLDAFGIPEAPDTLEALAVSEIAAGPTLVLTPGLAFDRGGGRLGRGKGYYDRFFASVDGLKPEPGHFFALGVCLTEQLVPAVPHESSDRKVDAVLADARLFGR